MYYKFFGTTYGKLAIIFIIVMMSVYFIYLGYNEKTTGYDNIYLKTVGTIVDKKIESIDVVEQKKNIFKHKSHFRIKLMYSYKVNEKEYTGFYYNDAIDDNFLEPNKYIPIGNTYNYVKKITVFYHKDKPHDSCVSITQIQKRKAKLFYIISIGLLFSIPFIQFGFDF